MKYYNQTYLESYIFYSRFFLPCISLTEYIIKENYERGLGDHEEAIEIVNQEYISYCKNYLNKNILFYKKLSQYLYNHDETLKSLDEYIFLKLRYYGTKCLDIENESRNFFEEERRKFKENHYVDAIINLSQFRFHDAQAIFKYNNKILQITYWPGQFEEIFEFFGVENWEEEEFLKKNPTLIVEELYEESPGIFIYNTLWNHEIVSGKDYSELSIKFTDLVQIKKLE